MAEKDVAIYGLVSEPQAKADLAKSEWNISYDVIGSQDMSLVKYLEDEKIINLVISEHKDKETYPNGMVQPGLLFIRSSLTCIEVKPMLCPEMRGKHVEQVLLNLGIPSHSLTFLHLQAVLDRSAVHFEFRVTK